MIWHVFEAFIFVILLLIIAHQFKLLDYEDIVHWSIIVAITVNVFHLYNKSE